MSISLLMIQCADSGALYNICFFNMPSDKIDKPSSIKKDWGSGGSGDGGTPEHEVLFTPEELDIYVNKVTLEAYIFHGKDVEYAILERLEYDPQDYSVTVVKKDGTMLDLGVKIQWLVRAYFTRAKEVSIVQTKNGESINGIVLPLIHKEAKKDTL